MNDSAGPQFASCGDRIPNRRNWALTLNSQRVKGLAAAGANAKDCTTV